HTDHNRTQSSNLLLARNRATIPGRWRVALAFVVNEREPLPFWVFKCESQPPIVLENFARPHTRFVEMRQPPCQRFRPVHTQRRANNAARASALSRRPPAEEREVCAWAAFRIRIEEMISTNVILIHRPLDQPHAQGLGVE